MLPDFIDLKRDFSKAAMSHLDKHRRSASTFLSEIRSRRLFEGGSNSIKRPGESEETTKMMKGSAELSISAEDMHKMSVEELFRRQEALIDQLVEQQTKYVIEVMNETTAKTGNIVDGLGQGLSPELLLKTFEKIEISFSGDGKPSMPTIVIHPSQEAQAKLAQEQLFEDPIYRRQFIELIEKKRKDWFAREADRILVG